MHKEPQSFAEPKSKLCAPKRLLRETLCNIKVVFLPCSTKEAVITQSCANLRNRMPNVCKEPFLYESFCNSFAKNIYLCKL
jgi:hypothetical protein